MDDQTRFKIVFKKLSEVVGEQAGLREPLSESEAMRVEIEEISELRRLVLQTTETEPKSYTTT
jgi:hypothetical protein